MAECKSCIHGNVCLHKSNIETDTYAYMGVNFDTEKCKHFMSADVVEVRHGEWIESTHWGGWYYDCPFCDDGFATRGRRETLPNFCSNCGAKLTGVKMDGERKDIP